MSVTELLPSLQNLSRADKLRIMQFLVLDLSKEEGIESSFRILQTGEEYPVWSHYDSHEAAHKLDELLEADRRSDTRNV